MPIHLNLIIPYKVGTHNLEGKAGLPWLILCPAAASLLSRSCISTE